MNHVSWSDVDEEYDTSLELLLGSGSGTGVSQEEDIAWLDERYGAEVLRGRAPEVTFLVNEGVGKPFDGAVGWPVLPMVFPDTAVPLLTAVSFPLHGGPGARVLSRGLRMLFASPVWIAGRGIPGFANQVETSNGSVVLVDDGSGGKVPVVIEPQRLTVVELSGDP